MITFYPRDIGLWRKDFDFSQRNGSFTLECKKQTDHKIFYDRAELIEFLKEHGVRLDDPNFPLEFTGPREHSELGYVYTVMQFHVMGWIKE